MVFEVGVRATAIGALVGAVVVLDAVGRSPELAASLATTALLAGPIVVAYVALAWGVGLALGLIGATLERIGFAGKRLVGAPVLWTLGMAGLLYAFLNELARAYHALEPFKRPLRGVLVLGALMLVARGLLRPSRRSRRTLLAERGLAALGGVALIGTLLYLRTPLPTGDSPGEDAGLLAPRFTEEPVEALEPSFQKPHPRVLLLGLDGASWDRIDRGIRAGSLPTFGRLVAGGVRAPLETVAPTYSPLIWTTIVTGVPPDAHGIRDFYLIQVPRLRLERLRLRRSADWAEEVLDAFGELRRVPVTSSLRRQKAIWNLADEAGMRTAVVGFWATWPPERLKHGSVVSDHTSLARRSEWLDRRRLSDFDEITTYPPSLERRLAPLQRSPDSVTREELAEFFPVSDAVWRRFKAARRFSKGVKLSAFRSTHLNDAFYLAAAQMLWDEEKPDLMVVYAKAIDELSHFFYEAGVPEAAALGWSAEEIARFGGTVDRTYAWMDRRIAPLVEAVDRDGRTLLVVVSDHGWAREADGGYNHNEGPPGILILYGAGVCRPRDPGATQAGEDRRPNGRACASPRDPSIYDIAPTVLERLHLPLSDELTGRPLAEAFKRSHETVRVRRYGGPLHAVRAPASAVDRELQEKLEALGYAD